MSNDDEIENDIDVNQTSSSYVELENLTTAFDRRIREFNINNVGFKSIEELFNGAFHIY